MNLVLRLLITMAALKGADLLLPNFNFHGGFLHLLYFSLVLGLLNWLVKPILVFFSVPLLIVTLGLFYLVINAVMMWCTSLVLPGVLSGSLSGIFWGSLIVSILHWFLSVLFRIKKRHE